jgi:chromosome transmission fidelity protein 18
MNKLVHIMASLELRFVQERAEDGQLSYRLDPYVLSFSAYPLL